MKQQRKTLSWFLLSVCVIMLMAAVFPHHHHHDLTLCMQYDLQQCEGSCHDPHHQHSSGQDCSEGCITHFQLNTQRHTDILQPDYSIVVSLFDMTEIFRLALLETSVSMHPVCYVEHLHTFDGQRIDHLRAPPSSSLL